MSGGSQEFIVYNTSSPTNYYKYHIFTGTSEFTLANPSASATDFSLMMVAGGGGGGGYPSSYRSGGGGGAGGLLQRTGPSLGLPAGTYNMTIGAGGYGFYTPNPNPTYNYQQYSQQGFDTHITPPTSPTSYLLRAYGGGAEVLIVDIILIPALLFQILLVAELAVLVDLVVEHTEPIMFPPLNHQLALVVLVSVDRVILEAVIHSINHLEVVM